MAPFLPIRNQGAISEESRESYTDQAGCGFARGQPVISGEARFSRARLLECLGPIAVRPRSDLSPVMSRRVCDWTRLLEASDGASLDPAAVAMRRLLIAPRLLIARSPPIGLMWLLLIFVLLELCGAPPRPVDGNDWE
jgi:hypothetical protein